VTTVPTQEDVLREVAEGRHLCGLATRQSTLYFMHKYAWSHLAYSEQAFYSADYGYAVAKGRQALLSKISEGLSAIKASGEYQKIYDRWFGAYEPEPIGWPKALKYVAYVAAPLLLLALLALVWSWNLRRQVAARTADLRQVVDALAESEKKHRLLAEQTLDMIWAMDTDLIFTYANPATERLTGYAPDAFVGTHLSKHFDEAHLNDLMKIIAQEITKGPENSDVILESRILRRDGSSVPIEVHGRVIFDEAGRPVLLQGTTRDISERREEEAKHESLQVQLLQMQKLDSVGRLAGGVAHDFNNLLMGIMGYTELCRDLVTDNPPALELLDAVLKEVKRSANLTRQLLAFARKQTVAPQVPVPDTIRIGGSETILLVEDEHAIRESMRLFLEQIGYTVLPAESPEAALRLAAEQTKPIDLLVTDVVMPGMNGRELSDRLRTEHAALRCLYLSGYTANVIAHRGVLEENVHFLSKPCSLNELARTIRGILDPPD